jgi:drug/metabolite transporter (DMT)-like permease
MTRPLGPGISTSVLAVYQTAMYAAVGGAIALVFGWGGLEMTGHPSLSYLSRPWVWLSLRDALLIMVIGASTGLLMVLFTRAYRLADSSFVAPFEYSAMLWAVLASYLILGELPDRTALAGIGLVVGAGLFMLLTDQYMVGKRSSVASRRGPEGPRQLDLTGAMARQVWPAEDVPAATPGARPPGRR